MKKNKPATAVDATAPTPGAGPVSAPGDGTGFTISPVPPNSLLRQWGGPLSEELLRAPGPFGLGQVPARLRPEATVRSVCGFCSTGCSLDIHLRENEAVNLTPTGGYPVNLGMACPKGWEALACLSAPDRLTSPRRRQADGSWQDISWPEAMAQFVGRFQALMAQHGRESVAFLSTGQICTEEMALLGALWKFGLGGVHADSNTRQCMATSHVAYKQSFGFDAPPFTYADFEESDVLMFVGANPCIAHPILWQRVLRNGRHPAVIVVDPRRTETAMNATQHLPLRPKSDLVFLYGLANLFVQRDWVDHDFIERSCSGYADFVQFIRQFTPDKVAQETSLTIGELYRCAETIHRGRAVSFWWTMGVNQSHEGTRTAQAIINLALMTGNIGRPGTGANSITGQCNAMGSRLFSNTSSLLGGRDFQRADHRAHVASLFGMAPEAIPTETSMAYDQIVDGVETGKIKALWIIGTNSAHSWIEQGRFSRLVDRLEFLVVQDMYSTTETAQRAHLLLPAAGWGEKDGTFINSERRIGLVRKVRRAPGNALSDFNIFRLVADAWGCGERFREWTSPEAAFQILKRLSAGQPCDFSGIVDYAHLDAAGGIQWPFPATADPGAELLETAPTAAPRGVSVGPPGPSPSSNDGPPTPARERRLFADGKFFTPDERARFLFDPPRPVGEPTNEAFPLVLLTGRGTSAQWHTNTRTGKSAVLRTLYPAKAYVEINPEDARRLGIAAQATVTVTSRRASIRCAAFITPTVPAGTVFIPMHYGVTNQLTRSEFDPHSRQPSYKHCAVRVEPLAPAGSGAHSKRHRKTPRS